MLEAGFAIVGLGNAPEKYARTKHNAGFWVIQELARLLADEATPKWSEKFGNRYLRSRDQSQQFLLVLPQKLMNLSGEASVPLLHFFKVPTENVLVIHDELDLAPGRIQIRRGGSTGGHHGLDDLVQHLGTRDFHRIRVGIGRPEQSGRRSKDSLVKDWLFSHPGPGEQELLNEAVRRAAEAALVWAKCGLEEAQRRFNSWTPSDVTKRLES